MMKVVEFPLYNACSTLHMSREACYVYFDHLNFYWILALCNFDNNERHKTDSISG